MMTLEQRDEWFTYHAPTDETAPKYVAQIHRPEADQGWDDPRVLFLAAEMELCKARMQANSAIACGGI